MRRLQHTPQASWRCGWCSRDRGGALRDPAPVETTGICPRCLEARRSVGHLQTGGRFLVWDQDADAALRWAAELRRAGG